MYWYLFKIQLIACHTPRKLSNIFQLPIIKSYKNITIKIFLQLRTLHYFGPIISAINIF